jgi:hypothetical protein
MRVVRDHALQIPHARFRHARRTSASSAPSQAMITNQETGQQRGSGLSICSSKETGVCEPSLFK